jgi:hypothetical protein
MYIKPLITGQIRSDTVGYGRERSDTVGNDRIRSDTVGYGYGYGMATVRLRVLARIGRITVRFKC